MLFVYIGSLVLLVVSAFYELDPDTQKPSDQLHTGQHHRRVHQLDARSATMCASPTRGVALLVTVVCFLIALPVCVLHRQDRLAVDAPRPHRRDADAAVGRLPGQGLRLAGDGGAQPAAQFAAGGKGGGGFLESTFGWTPGYGRAAIVITLVYFWLPYMVLPIYAGLERLPPSLLDAAGDLGAKPFRTFRSVMLPLLLPSIAAGSIFTFSLSLGDYIVPQMVNNGKEKFMFGTLINSTLGAPNQPLAAAYTLWPLIIVILYLIAMKRLGAFENL